MVTTFKYVGGRLRQSLAEVVWNICFSGCLRRRTHYFLHPSPIHPPPSTSGPSTSTLHLPSLRILHPLYNFHPSSPSPCRNEGQVGGSDFTVVESLRWRAWEGGKGGEGGEGGVEGGEGGVVKVEGEGGGVEGVQGGEVCRVKVEGV